MLAPGVVAGAPRCIAWWWADQQARIVPLHVDTDPSSAEYYDYTSTAWYREPERTGQPAVAGPYVDFICTREYTFTLAVPVRSAGRFIGVAGADMLAAQVERLVLPELARIGQAAVLTTGQGRVIASNTASILPGSAVPAGAAGRCRARQRPAAVDRPAAAWVDGCPAGADSEAPRQLTGRLAGTHRP